MRSDIKGLYKLDPDERVKKVTENLGFDDLSGIGFGKDSSETLDSMIENVIGVFRLPIGLATNFRVNGTDRLIPMATEESSVVAAASKGAKIARRNGGFEAYSGDQIMIGQVQITDLEYIDGAVQKIRERKDEIINLANEADPLMVKLGGGAIDLKIRKLDGFTGEYLVLHLLVNCLDAMGANAVNTMAESITPAIEELTGGNVVLRIISNLADRRLSTARAVFDRESLGGAEAVERIMKAYELAKVDPYRASTHNKGIMNGVSAVVRATGNDTRAVEAGAHSYAALYGRYGPLTRYSITDEGDLLGEITIPTAVGTVGGITKVHPGARTCLKILGIEKAGELGEILASVGLAQNLAALRALAMEGIQKGHMKLHARNMAIQSGAEDEEIDQVVSRMLREDKVTASDASRILSEIRG